MKTDEERFEDYLHNSLSEEEKADFEQDLLTNDQFRSDFEAYQMTSQFLALEYAEDKNDFLKQLEQSSDEFFNAQKKDKIFKINPKYFAVAAMFLVVISVFILTDNTSTNYADYNQHPEAAFVERSDNQALVLKAQQTFNEKKYKEAITAFEQLNLSENKEWQLFYAICLIETNADKQAENQLKVLLGSTHFYDNKAKWYLGLLNLKQKDHQKANEWFKQIDEDAEDYKKAQKLIRKLK